MLRVSTKLLLSGVLSTGLFVEAQAKTSGVWECLPATKLVCSDGDCQASSIQTWGRVNIKSNLYSRCDLKGCDDYPFLSTEKGAFITIELPTHGAFIKVGPPPLKYKAAETKEGFRTLYPVEMDEDTMRADIERRRAWGILRTDSKVVAPWTEVVSVGNGVIVSTGYCRPLPLPEMQEGGTE
jgi:hypothetical protein